MEYPEYISKTEAKKLIAERTCKYPKNGGLRAKKNSIGGHLVTRIKKNEIATDENGLLLFLDVSKYAKKKFPGKFDDWPSVPNEFKAEIGMWQTNMRAVCINLPLEIDECHKLIGDLHKETLRLTDVNLELQAEIDRLKPDAEKWLNFQQKSGRRGMT